MRDADPVADGTLDNMFAAWLPGAMFPSELVWLAHMIRQTSTQTVIECGRQDGVSTWVLATLLRDTGIQIISVDFDTDSRKLLAAQERLRGLPATCVTGDIHVEVPRLLRKHPDTSTAVVQDGPKGWEGLGTLLAAALEPDVVLVAQHNLHLGHRTRTAFQMLSVNPCFLETAAPDDVMLQQIRAREIADLAHREPNRPLDHSSLGVIPLDAPGQREHLGDAIKLLRREMAPWDPIRVRDHWAREDFEYCTRLRARSRYTLARFKKR